MPEKTQFEFTLDHKEDIWRIPMEVRVLHVHCALNEHAAEEIITRAHLLEKVVFTGTAFHATPVEARNYLSTHTFIEAESERGDRVNAAKATQIRELYAQGGHTLESLERHFKLTREQIWEVVHEKKFGENHG